MKKHKEKAVVALYDEERRILLQDRKGISKAGEEWGFFGGGIESGETPEQALVREIKEELNVTLRTFTFFRRYKVFLLDNESYNEIFLFVAPLGDLLKNAKQTEGRAMKLFSIAEMKNLKLNRSDGDVIQDIEKYFHSHNINDPVCVGSGD
jgi:mutator protein MutT